MSSFYEKVDSAARKANEQTALEDLKNLIMGSAMGGQYQVVLSDDDIKKFDDTISDYLTCQGFKINKSEKEITISWEKEIRHYQL